MKKIAITGNIASGKSTAENFIKAKGFKIIDADFICHDALVNNEKIINNVKKNFCNYDILDANGNLDRTKLGRIIFKNQELKNILENILHPHVKEKISEFIDKNKNEKIIFASVPLLFESEMQDIFDEIILVCADENIRLERIMKRNNFTREHSLERIKSQIPQEEKVKKAHIIINNNGNINELEQNVEEILFNLNQKILP